MVTGSGRAAAHRDAAVGATASFEPLRQSEQMLGSAFGRDFAAPPLPQAEGASARVALENVVARSFERGRCHVLFSGGRDSSLVLAVATHVARRIGADDPLPVTAVYPGVPGADESAWQDLVLAHLGLSERIVIEIDEQRRHLGATARANLSRRGPVWPVAVQTQNALYGELGDVDVLTGEGGDGIIAPHRGAALTLLLRDRRRPGRALLRAGAQALEPQVLYRYRERRRWTDPERLPWLRATARRRFGRAVAQERLQLRWDRSQWDLAHLRGATVAFANATVAAAEFGVRVTHPLVDPEFVAALSHQGGAWGYWGRTQLFRILGGDLLPDAILARSTKSFFNDTRWGEGEREFARNWSGAGIDADEVDPEALRAEWLSERPHPLSAYLLHRAWVADNAPGLLP